MCYINNEYLWSTHIQPRAADGALHHSIPGHWTCSFMYHFQLPGGHTALQQCGAIVRTTIVISVPPGTHLHLSEVEHSRVKCIVQEHKIDTTMSQC